MDKNTTDLLNRELKLSITYLNKILNRIRNSKDTSGINIDVSFISLFTLKTDRSAESMLFQPKTKPYGLTYSEWTVKWWQWLLSISIETNPALDPNGMHVSENQLDPHVWFLTGTFGGSVVRVSKIPSRRALFIPVINYQCSFADYPDLRTENDLRSKCEKEIDDIKNLSFVIDDLPLIDLSCYRVRSPLFEVELTDNNVLNNGKCTTQMISDGYWVFVKPLETGIHQLISSGSCQSGKIMIGSTYILIVQ